ncbi:hypothetical protein ILUMI_01123 [Ignelater luminosus]|uniref:Uncharacterized protein n=1 Tax=Ignelater luminosus TaxID=2038154 RepID=A0A8K0GM03_IGNLU|nr:hypothetical protein ILUMI_01123 [Ignelater luminosus]
MRKIHSSVLAIVMSIFLIQATDPPYEKNLNHFIQSPITKSTFQNSHFIRTLELRPPKIERIEFFTDNTPLKKGSVSENKNTSLCTGCKQESSGEIPKENTEGLKLLQDYISQINSGLQPRNTESTFPESEQKSHVDSSPYEAIHKFLSRQGKTEYEKLLEKDFVQPLLKLYENQNHTSQSFQESGRISKEDTVEDLTKLSKEDLDQLLHNQHIYQQPAESSVGELQSARRTDEFMINDDKEHIGEILPPNYKESDNFDKSDFNRHELSRSRILFKNNNRRAKTVQHYRKSYDYNDDFRPTAGFPMDDYDYRDSPIRYRQPISFPDDSRFRPEYDFSGISSEGYDTSGYTAEDTRFRPLYARPDVIPETFPNSDPGFPRHPRPPPNEYSSYVYPRRQRGYRDGIQDGNQWSNPWASSRRPRVIFPSDLVAFKDQNQEEPDWLAGDANLQDLQQPDNRDRGLVSECAPDSTCEFFLSCWISGGLLEGPCDGILHGCCHRGASKTGNSFTQAVGTIEAPRESPKAHAGLLDVETRCGISTRQQAQRRIVGGDEAGFGTFPWQAYIRIGSSRYDEYCHLLPIYLSFLIKRYAYVLREIAN